LKSAPQEMHRTRNKENIESAPQEMRISCGIMKKKKVLFV